MKKLLLLLLIAASSLMVRAQSEQASVLQGIEGDYTFIYGDLNHNLSLSAADDSFVELDVKGNELGKGQILLKGGTYILVPTSMTEKSILNTNVKFTIDRQLDDRVVITVHVSDVEKTTVDLIKL